MERMWSPPSRVYRCLPSFRSHSMACPSCWGGKEERLVNTLLLGGFFPKGAQRIMQKTLPSSPRINFKIYPTALVKRNFAHCAKWHWVTFKNKIASEKTKAIQPQFTTFLQLITCTNTDQVLLLQSSHFSTWQLVSETLPPKDR